MKPTIRGLLICDQGHRFEKLKSICDALSIKTGRARTCREAGTRLCESPLPHLVVTDTILGDGNWMDILDFSARSKEKVNVIVVSPFADMHLYIDVMDHGAFDFITDAFSVPEVIHVFRSAIDNALGARGSAQRIAAPSPPADGSWQAISH
jgi:DNA-binding NtrC family response regulator